MDVRLWSKELISDFINLYKSFTCLWKVKSEEYKNRTLRDLAYNKIIEFCKLRGFPEANRDFVVKKIQSLRGSFRKELKKIHDSQRSGRRTEEIYTPSLWYYDLLLFTKDQELPPESVSNIDDSEKEVDQNYMEKDEDQARGMEEVMRRESQDKNEVSITPTRIRPRKRKIIDPQAEFLQICTATLKANSQPMTEYDAFGINVSKKLAKMEPAQSIYAESLISGIIRKGLLNKLMEETDFCENGCNFRRTETSYSLSSSTSSTSLLQPMEYQGRSTVLRSFSESSRYDK